MEARVNVTFMGQNGDLVDPIDFDTPTEDVLTMVEEAISSGGAVGITYQGVPNLEDFVVDRFNNPPRLFVRPKTPFG